MTKTVKNQLPFFTTRQSTHLESSTSKEPKREIQFGFLKGIVPPLPDSFFDPLPEEELQTWGL